MADVQVDSSTNPQSFGVFIKCSKTDPFCKGCFIFLGCGSFPLCPVVSLTNYLHLRGPGPVLSLFTKMALLSPGLSCVPFFKLPYNQQVSLESSQAIVFELEPQLLLPVRAFVTISLRLWGIGLVKLTCYMILQWKPSFLSQDDLPSRYELLYPSFGLFFWARSDLGVLFFGLWLPRPWAPLFSEQCLACSEVLRLGCGASWLGFLDLPAMGAVSI